VTQGGSFSVAIGDGGVLSVVASGGTVIADGGPISVSQAGAPWSDSVTTIGDGGALAVTQQGAWNFTLADGGALAVTQQGGWDVVISDGGALAVLQQGAWNFTLSDGGALAVTQSGPPWSVNVGSVSDGGALAVTEQGTWNIGSVADGGALAVSQSGPPWSVSTTTISDGGPLSVNATEVGTWNVGTIGDGGALTTYEIPYPDGGFPEVVLATPITVSVIGLLPDGGAAVAGVAIEATDGGIAPVLNSAIANAQGNAPSSASTGAVVRLNADLLGDLYVLLGSPNHNFVTVTISTSITTEIAAPAAGNSIYLYNLTCQSTTSTASTVTMTWGTGTNCGTPTSHYVFPCTANTAAAGVSNWIPAFELPAAQEICLTCSSGTNTCNTTLQYYIAN
jgi:hypothetical protein